MNTNIKIGIVAHRARLSYAETLADKVGASVLSVDDGLMGCTRHHIKVWTNLVQHGGDWLVVLEDDAVPVDGFREQLEMALDNSPPNRHGERAGIVSLYLGTGFPRAWQRFIKKAITEEKDANYVVSSHLLHAVGTAIRLELVNDMLRFVAWMSQDQRQWPIDEQITHWARMRGHLVAYTRPSLVDHMDGPSLVAHPDGQGREGKRVAYEVGCRHEWDGFKQVVMP